MCALLEVKQEVTLKYIFWTAFLRVSSLFNLKYFRTSLILTGGGPDAAHLEPSMESMLSPCSSDSVASEGAGSGSGFRRRKKRKQPTRLMTVRVMNTV